ncbi:hypothetical protein GCM10027570_06080 [Streptomonospora sediminis]
MRVNSKFPRSSLYRIPPAEGAGASAATASPGALRAIAGLRAARRPAAAALSAGLRDFVDCLHHAVQ